LHAYNDNEVAKHDKKKLNYEGIEEGETEVRGITRVLGGRGRGRSGVQNVAGNKKKDMGTEDYDPTS
jgi:hypothetical protein